MGVTLTPEHGEALFPFEWPSCAVGGRAGERLAPALVAPAGFRAPNAPQGLPEREATRPG